MIIQEGNKTLVDTIEYNLGFHGAIQRILVGKDVLAQPFGDYSIDASLEDFYPAPVLIKAIEFKGKSYQEIGNELSQYENFSKS
jgi:hypothetical protein